MPDPLATAEANANASMAAAESGSSSSSPDTADQVALNEVTAKEADDAAQQTALKAQEATLRAKLAKSAEARTAITKKVPVTTGAPKPIRIVDLDARAAAPAAAPGAEPHRFFFGEVGKIPLPNGTKFNATKHHIETYDDALADLLTKASANKALKIFPE